MKRVLLFAVLTSMLTTTILVVGISYFASRHLPNNSEKGGASMFKVNALRPSMSEMPDFADVAENVTAAVVNIKATTGSSDLLDNLWGSGSSSISTGSGVVIGPEGYIVTNQHVIERSSQIEITLGDKRIFNAKVIGEDEASDLALLKINISDQIPHVELANSDELRVGQWVLAVGNPFNLSSTVTAGIVSAKGRNIDITEGEMSPESFIQTDAAVNPGNSGGALVNTRGELLGINTAIMTRTGSYEGYSFAIPSNIVKKVIKDLKEFGMVQRAFVGIVPSEVTPILAQKLGLKNNGGVHIAKIQHGGAAEDAGLKEGDVILSLDKTNVRTMAEYQQQLSTYRPGADIQVTFWRNGKTDKVVVKLKNQANSAGVLDKQALDMLNQLGFQTRDLTATEQQNLQSQGVMVVSIRPGSKIALTNMEQDFIITKINGKNIKNQAAFISGLNMTSEKVLLEGFYPSIKGIYAYTFIK